MRPWEHYRRYLLSGEWHAHTSFTDGENTVTEMAGQADRLGIPLIAFTEHVRKALDYDFGRFLEEVDEARQAFPSLVILSGVEAKVLPDGSLDVADDVIGRVDYPVFAFHGIPASKEVYLRCLRTAIESERACAWAHPGFHPRHGLGLDYSELIDVFKAMARHGVLLELNAKHDLPPESWLRLAVRYGVDVVRGSDAHSVNDLVAAKVQGDKRNSGQIMGVYVV